MSLCVLSGEFDADDEDALDDDGSPDCADDCPLPLSALAADGFVDPLILRTYCSAEAWISSAVAGGSKLWSVLMFRHMRPA